MAWGGFVGWCCFGVGPLVESIVVCSLVEADLRSLILTVSQCQRLEARDRIREQQADSRGKEVSGKLVRCR